MNTLLFVFFVLVLLFLLILVLLGMLRVNPQKTYAFDHALENYIHTPEMKAISAACDLKLATADAEKQERIDECAEFLRNSRAQLAERYGYKTCVHRQNFKQGKFDFEDAWDHVENLAEAKYGFYITYDARQKLHLI